jgi:hypothetical protein
MNNDHQIFARAVPGAPKDAPISEIIDRVKMPGALRRAIDAWRQLQTEYEASAGELRAAVGQMQAAGGEIAVDRAVLKRIAALQAEQHSLSERIRTALQDIATHKPPFLQAVATALGPLRKTAALRGLAACQALSNSLDALDEVSNRLANLGAPPDHRPAMPNYRSTIALTVARLRQLVE